MRSMVTSASRAVGNQDGHPAPDRVDLQQQHRHILQDDNVDPPLRIPERLAEGASEGKRDGMSSGDYFPLSLANSATLLLPRKGNADFLSLISHKERFLSFAGRGRSARSRLSGVGH